MRRLVIVTGLSGAGKSQAMKSFEDFGFACLDNAPPVLAREFVTLAERSGSTGVALALDVRTLGPFGDPVGALDALEAAGFDPEVLFLDAEDETLIRRFSETRRRHPYGSETGGMAEAIAAERAALAGLRDRASVVWDTSRLTLGMLKDRIGSVFAATEARRLGVAVVAFGFKYGLPLDADLVFDVRFLPNPNYVEGLRELTGADAPVAAYLEALPDTEAFLERLFPLVDFLVPRFEREGKSQVTVAIGCTGGRHRSVYLGRRLRRHLTADHRRQRQLRSAGREPVSSRVRRSLGLARWLQPGLGVKRWLLLAALGATLFVNGVSRYLTDEGTSLRVNELVDSLVVEVMPPSYLSYVFIVLGALLVALGIWRWLNAIVTAVAPNTLNVIDAVRSRRLERGYKIVVVGGGTGLSTMLRGLKKISTNLTAVVTVSDDGGSSGRLQKELGVLPPGDIRNCLVALADDEALVTELFRYRFQEGEGLSGHSFGNLFLAAMTGITGNFDEAIKVSSRVLNVKGRVLPSTLAVARLAARMSDGRIIEGESQITAANGRIEEVFLDPPYAAPLDEVITALREADAIVLGPGSLYTSIMPNLLVDRVAREIELASAVKIYVCNVMTQPGETDGYSASTHVRALMRGSDGALVRRRGGQRRAAAQAARRVRRGGPVPGRRRRGRAARAGDADRARQRHQRNADRAPRPRPPGRGRDRHHRRNGRRARLVRAPPARPGPRRRPVGSADLTLSVPDAVPRRAPPPRAG